MISQIRIYTINKGEMDNFLKHFNGPWLTSNPLPW
jgi:hypothetical protein